MEEIKTETKKDPTLQETLARIADNLDDLKEQKKVKGFKLPWRGKVGKGKIKKGWVTIVYLMSNKGVRFTRAPINEQIVVIDDIPHYVSPKHILNYKNKPLIVQPEWSESPLCVEEEIKEDNSSMGWKYIVNWLEKTKITEKKKFGAGMWIILVLIVIGLGYYLFKSGAFH